jgi:hypothetical protein
MSADLTFQLYISLGNEAMRTAYDLSVALHRIADGVVSPREMAPFSEIDAEGNLGAGWYQTILDDNGNDVGRYAVKDKGAS